MKKKLLNENFYLITTKRVIIFFGVRNILLD